MKDLLKTKAILAKNTRTRYRQDNLYYIANFILELKNKYGDLKTVSKEVAGISVNMLNRFLSVLNLDKRILPYVINRQIDNINAIYYIQTLSSDEQLYIAEQIVQKKINSADIRALKPLRSRYPKKSINEILSSIIQSKNRKRYLIKFDFKKNVDLKSISKYLENIINKDEFVIEKKNKIVTIILSHSAYKILKELSNKKNMTYKDLIKSILQIK